MKAVIKFRGEKRIVDIKYARLSSDKELSYFCHAYCLRLNGRQVYALELDGLRNYNELEDSCT